tara:strand:+ start:465 stop:968 length:504 start_codon:yes stop_codon:yes gene_type:complete
MSNNNILLRSLIEPDAPSLVAMLPMAWGWKLLLVLIAGIALLTFLKAVKRYHRNHYRRVALAALQKLRFQSPERVLSGVNSLLKQAACHAYPLSKVASLQQQQWLAFLGYSLRHSKAEVDFIQPLFLRWQLSLYKPCETQEWSQKELEVLIDSASIWIKQHRWGYHD